MTTLDTSRSIADRCYKILTASTEQQSTLAYLAHLIRQEAAAQRPASSEYARAITGRTLGYQVLKGDPRFARPGRGTVELADKTPWRM